MEEVDNQTSEIPSEEDVVSHDILTSEREEQNISTENEENVTSVEFKMAAVHQKEESNKEQKVLSADHPLMIKYQKDLKERLLKLLQETEEQLVDLKRTIQAQEDENAHFAKRGYEIQNDLKQQEERLKKIYAKYDEQIEIGQNMHIKSQDVKEKFRIMEETWHEVLGRDTVYQKKLEDIAFEVVQLTTLKAEAFTDAKSLKRAVEKTSKDKENLELQKMRQDVLISRLENDKFNLEDKINLYKAQRAIKKEEALDLRKELIAANAEIQSINSEKQQIVHQWKQSLSSLEKQDLVLAEIQDSAREFEEEMRTINMDITAHKKSVRKELERNEQLTLQLQFRESDIAHIRKNLSDAQERENNLQENIAVVAGIVEITERELQFLNDSKIIKEKEVDAKDKEIQKACSYQKKLEKKHMDILHEKITVTKASKYTEKLIQDIRNSISMNEDKGSRKEREREKLLLKVDDLRTYINNLQANMDEVNKERAEKEALLNKTEADVLKKREKMDIKRGEYKALELQLNEMISEAGGQELGPFEREIANLKKEIVVAEQGKRNMEQEYLRFQRELFSLSKQSAVRSEENDLYNRKIALMEGKKIQLEADIAKEEKEIKDTENRIQCLENDIIRINKLLSERTELQEHLQQTSELSKSDFINVLKDAELNYLRKKAELSILRRKKKKYFLKLIEAQRLIVYWEGKIHLAEETRRILKSDAHLDELFNLKSEIRRLHVKQEQIKRDQESLVKDMERAVERHTNLYVEADKQALFGKRRKTPEYVTKRIKNTQKKVQEDTKALESCKQQIQALELTKSQLSDVYEVENQHISEMMDKIHAIEYDTDNKQQEKRQAVISLSFKQKKTKFMQKIQDGTYIRAVRNETRRLEELERLKNNFRILEVIAQSVINEDSELEKDLNKVLDYIYISKQI